MSKRWWLLGVGGLVLVGLLVACGSNYSSSSDGLVLVGSQGSGLLETFSFNLNSGHVSAIANTPNDTVTETCVLGGLPSSIVMGPGGTYAYTIVNANTLCDTANFTSTTGIVTFKVNSDGTLGAPSSQIALKQETVLVQGTNNITTTVPVVPQTMVIDAAGKFVFIADRATTDPSGLFVPGAISVFSIGSAGALTEIAGSPFFAVTPATTLTAAGLDITSVAPSPTVFPGIGVNGVQNAVCSTPGANPPTAEYLYATDGLGNQVFEFQVDTTAGTLGVPSGLTTIQSFPTDQIPVAVAVDPCDRFVYVSNSLSNRISAYTLCSVVIMTNNTCPIANGSLVQVPGSPFSLSGSANGAGPLVVDPYGNNLYVLGTKSNTVSPFKIGSVKGDLTALNPATVATGLDPTSIVIRGDDNWMFVTNFNAATVSQYSITPASGALTAEQPITTDNQPWGVAVK